MMPLSIEFTGPGTDRKWFGIDLTVYLWEPEEDGEANNEENVA